MLELFAGYCAGFWDWLDWCYDWQEYSVVLSKFLTACPTLFSNSIGEFPECSLLVEGDL